jgi:hypothetical protein
MPSRIPTAPALAAVTAPAEVLRATGGERVYVEARREGRARILVEDARARVIAKAWLAQSSEWSRIDEEE